MDSYITLTYVCTKLSELTKKKCNTHISYRIGVNCPVENVQKLFTTIIFVQIDTKTFF